MDQNDLQAAHATYTEATQIYEQDLVTQPTRHLVTRQKCWTQLGRLYRRQVPADLQKARFALRKARACAETFRGQLQSQAERRRVQADAIQDYELLFETCIDLWLENGQADDLREALEVAEASRTRNLLDLLTRQGGLQPLNTQPEHAEELRTLVERFQARRRWLWAAEERLAEAESQAASQSDAVSEPDDGSP
jgi:hypothetical protein